MTGAPIVSRIDYGGASQKAEVACSLCGMTGSLVLRDKRFLCRDNYQCRMNVEYGEQAAS